MLKRKALTTKERFLYSEGQQPEEKVRLFPGTNSKDTARPWKLLKESSVQSLSYVRLFATPWTAACQASLPITNSQSLLKLKSIESVMPSNNLILSYPLLLPPSISPSIRVFSSEPVLPIRWPNLEFQLQHQSFQWIFRTDFLQDWLAWSLCSPRDSQESSPTPQFKSINSKAQFKSSTFFIVQLSHPYITTGKTIALTDGPLLAK